MPETWNTPGHLHETGGAEPTENGLRATAESTGDSPFPDQQNPVAAARDAEEAARKIARQQRKEQWKHHRFDAELLRTLPTGGWAWRLAERIKHRNSDRDPVKDAPTLWFSGSDAVEYGATDEQIKVLPPLTGDQHEKLMIEAEVQRQYLAKRTATEGAQRLQREQSRAEGYVPPAEALFDFDRDFAALRAPEPLIPGLVETGAAAQLIAEPNVGKTFVALAWACSLALQGRQVIYAVADDSVYQIVRRVLGWCVAHDAEPREVFGSLRLFTRPAQFADDEDMNALASMVRANGSVMVVFDTQHQCSAGLAENSNDDARVITAACKRLTALGAAVLLVHHTGDGGKTGRGAKSVHGYLSTTLAVTETKQDGRRYLKVAVIKQKNMPRGEALLYPFELVEIPPALRAGVISDADARTMVARTTADPFDTVPGHTGDTIKAFRLYGVLWALDGAARPLNGSTVSTFTKERVKPLLIAKGYMKSTAKQMPHGFGRGEIDKLLAALAKAEPSARLVDESGSANAVIARYELTERGRDELAALADNLRIGGGGSGNDA